MSHLLQGVLDHLALYPTDHNETVRAVVQRVSRAHVALNGQTVAECDGGLLLLVGIHKDDASADAEKLADKVFNLRIFNDREGRINLSLPNARELPNQNRFGILAVSNFTVYGDVSKSRRPSFTASAQFELGKKLFDQFVAALMKLGAEVQTGIFGEDMQIHLINDGPMTLIVDTR